jgi:PAS domain S-box-containing protein
LLVAGKFPRFAAAIAIVAPVLVTLDQIFLPSNRTALFISNTLDFLVIALAVVCSFHAAKRCKGFSRQLWMLVGVAIGLEAIGQALTTYYQSFDRAALQGALPSDILFFVWAAPIFMIFLPRSDEEEYEVDWLRMLDFVQVAIVALTMYLYFFFAPARWSAGQYSMLSGILWVYITRDALLGLAFFTRSRSAIPEWFRSFCRVMTVVFAVLACSDAIYLITLNPTGDEVTWGDILLALAHAIVVWRAITWNAPQSTTETVPRSKVGRFFAQQILPIAMPLLVILLASAIALEQFALAWLVVIVSMLCSSVRLILTNRETRRVAEHLLDAEKALRTSEQMMSTAYRSSPDAFSINVYPNGPYLEVNEGFTRLTGFTREDTVGKTPREMNLWVDAEERDKTLEKLEATGAVRDVEFHFRRKDEQIRIGQMSACLVELEGRRCSLVVVRDITMRKEAEEILRSSEERFRSLVQNLHVGILTFGLDGKIMFANQAITDLLHQPLEKLIGKVPSEFGLTPLAEDGSPMPEEIRPVARVIATGETLRSVLVGWRRGETGNVVWTLLDAVPEYATTGQLLRVVVSVTNVTEQRHATEALRESEERFRTLVSELHVGVTLHQPDGRIEYVNPALMRMLGMQDLSVIPGKLPSELGVVAIAEDGRELTEEERPVSAVIRTKTAMRDVLLGFRLPWREKPVWVFGSSVPHLDANGNLVRVITSFMDMTEHRHALEALRESEERFRTLVRDLHVAVVLHTPDGKIEFANAAAYSMFNVPEGHATGKTIYDYGMTICDENGNDLPREEHPLAKVFGTGIPVPNGLLGLRIAGMERVLWVFGTVVPQFDANGKVIRAISTFADVSQMKNAEQAIHRLSTQLMRLQDEERRRLGRELHDGLAQTVLAINLNLAQVRQSLSSDEHPASRAVEKARSLTQQMSREIRTLSYLLHPPLLDELGLVSALREYAHGFGERSSIDTQLQILTEFHRLPQELELALFRIVQESLANIQKHSGSTRAEIQLRQEGALVALEIRDWGRGLVVPVNGSSSPTRLGVGIAGMRERMSQLGGRLEIESGDGGTTVRAMISLTELKIREDVTVADLAGRVEEVET